MKFFTDFWEEMNDVKMIDKKIGQPKLYDDQRVFWYKVVYRTFYRKKTFIELKKNFENSIYLQPLNCHTMKHYYDANQPIE